MKTRIETAREIARIAGTKWNGKFYSYKDGKTYIFAKDEKIDVTEMYQEAHEEDGYIRVSMIYDEYIKIIDPIIDLEFDLEFGDITEEEFQAKKEEIINK